MTISILALKGKLNGKILLLRFFLSGIFSKTEKCSNVCFTSSSRQCNIFLLSKIVLLAFMLLYVTGNLMRYLVHNVEPVFRLC